MSAHRSLRAQWLFAVGIRRSVRVAPKDRTPTVVPSQSVSHTGGKMDPDDGVWAFGVGASGLSVKTYWVHIDSWDIWDAVRRIRDDEYGS